MFVPQPQYSPEEIAALGFSGVYFLFRDNSVVYVGQSTHVPRRIAQHIRAGRMQFDRVSVLPTETKNLLRVEADYIRELTPEYNETGPRAELTRFLDAVEHNYVGELDTTDIECGQNC